MTGPKARITALDWARAKAYEELKVLVEHYEADSPPQWTWRVSGLNRHDPNILVRVLDRELGISLTHVVRLHLPFIRMQDELQFLFERMIYQRVSRIDRMKRSV